MLIIDQLSGYGGLHNFGTPPNRRHRVRFTLANAFFQRIYPKCDYINRRVDAVIPAWVASVGNTKTPVMVLGSSLAKPRH